MRPGFSTLLAIVALLAGGALAGCSTESSEGAKLQQGQSPTERLMRLMDKDQDGKVTKEEFMSFMSQEFDRIDQDKSLWLSPQEIKAWDLGL